MYSVNVVRIITLCWAVSSTVNANTVGDSCTITDFSQVENVVKSCNNIIVKSLRVPAGKTLYLNLKQGSSLTFEGITIFDVAQWDGPLVTIEGTQLKVNGATGSRLDGQGAKYWDGKGDQGTKKPRFFTTKGSGEFDNINLLNCPKQCTAFAGSNISISGWNIDVSAGDKNKLGHNTDGIGVSGHDITVKNCVVKNQDDCVTVGRGKNIHFRNIYCSGGHGLSVSVGLSKTVYEDNVVSNISFTECTVVNSVNGIHVKVIKDGGAGVVQDVSYSHITLQGITKFGVEIHQDYPEQDGKHLNDKIPIRGLTLTDIKGTMSGKKTIPVKVLCASGACSDWKFTDISIIGHRPCSMNYHPSGFSC